jgi:hypothetical protein
MAAPLLKPPKASSASRLLGPGSSWLGPFLERSISSASGGGRLLFYFLSIRTFQQLRLKFAAKNLDGDVNSHKKERNSNYASSATSQVIE